MITLLIKGDRHAASRAVTARRVVVFARPLVEFENGFTRVDVANSELEKVTRWYIETIDAPVDGVGYPPGTLLLYTFREMDEEEYREQPSRWQAHG